jgi:hypothetical protein
MKPEQIITEAEYRRHPERVLELAAKYSEIIITNRGKPAYIIRPISADPVYRAPDYDNI